MKTLTRSVLVCLCICFSFPAWAQFAGGSGTAPDPYLVCNANQLSSVRYYPTSHFLQIADIDLNIYPYNQGTGWQTITFNGYYDGANFHIANLMINRPGISFYHGLFDGGLDLRNICLDNISITGGIVIGGLTAHISTGTITNCSVSGSITGEGMSSGTAGGLVGLVSGSITIANCQTNVQINNANRAAGLLGDFMSAASPSTISNCSVSGSVNGGSAAGLCLGMSDGQITGCSTDCLVTSNTDAGGLLVGVSRSIISNCHATGAVSSLATDGYCGGLIGSASGSQITECYATGNVQIGFGTFSSGGGLLGACQDGNYASDFPMLIDRCYATGNVSGNTAGGLIGEAFSSYGLVTVSNCYSRGNANGEWNAGGFVGKVMSMGYPNGAVQILNCFCTGNATVQYGGNGGFGGYYYEEAIIEGCFWNTDTSSCSSDFGNNLELPGVHASHTTQMTYPQSVNTFIEWDFVSTWAHDADYAHNNGYPYLGVETPGTVDPISFDPPPGSYYQGFYLTLACPTPIVDIYYTLDGSEPSESSAQFMGEIVITHSTTVKAIAYRPNWEPSEICTAVYTFPNAADDDILPSPELSLSAYPNPFSHSLSLECKLPGRSFGSLQIYNLRGQLVRNLCHEEMGIGSQIINWDGMADNGKPAAQGIYLCRLIALGQEATCRVMLLR